MKKKKVLMSLLTFALVSCGNPGANTGNSSSQVNKDEYVKDTPTLVDDSELAKYDDLDSTFDNRMIMPDIGGSKEVPDPFVLRWNGMYYLYPTTNGRKQKAYKSQDLVNWEPVDNGTLSKGLVYDYSSDGSSSPSSQTPFAPEVAYFNGKFYMISSPSGNGHYVFESDSPEGPFTCISENLGHSIDGSFFIDSDEQIYLYGASGGGIRVYQLDDDFTTFLTNDNDQEIDVSLSECRVGGWNEGPYMLKRYGEYYITYCGSHYLSSSYRVDYAHCNPESNLLSQSSYVREDTIAVATKDTFKGLGHSSTVLGPDMDSYYLAYHNLENNTLRYLNLARLSFNGATMVADSVRERDIPNIRGAEFTSDGLDNLTLENGYYLSDLPSGKNFTAEFNVTGEGKMVFSYENNSNYSYIEFVNNTIYVRKVLDGTTLTKQQIDLNHEFDTSVMHSFRIQYGEGKSSFYFDGMEKSYNFDSFYTGGKIGFEESNSFDEIGYVAFSNVANGSSDNEYYNSDVSLANSYDKRLSYLRDGSELTSVKKGMYKVEGSYNLTLANEGDRATYRTYQPEDGTYSINLRVPSTSLGKKIGIKVDNEPMVTRTIPNSEPRVKNGDTYFSLHDVFLDEGQHNISLYEVGDKVSFSEIHYELLPTGEDFELDFTKNPDVSNFVKRNNVAMSNKGIFTDNQYACGLISEESYRDVIISMDVNVSDVQSGGFVGIVLGVTDYSKNYPGDGDGGDNFDMFRGLQFGLSDTGVYLRTVDFNFGQSVNIVDHNYPKNQKLTLTVEKSNNCYSCYLNDELVIDTAVNVASLQGQVGFMSSRINAYVSNLSVANA